MKKFFIALVLLATIGAIFASTLSEIDLIMDTMKSKPKKELFKVFHFLHKKTYSLDSEEGLMRFKIFKENIRWTDQKNAQLGKQVYGITNFMDITEEEFRKVYLMDPFFMQNSINNLKFRNTQSAPKTEAPKSAFEIYEEEEIPEPIVSQTPTNIDWRHMMNPAKDQKSCGSCWSFAAIASIEGTYNINYQKLLNLSEQYLLECDTADNGCNGGWPTRTFDWLKSNGVVENKDSVYLNKRTVCQSSKFEPIRKNLIKDFDYCEKGVAGKECTREIWMNLLARGPVVVAMDASDQGFSMYKPKNQEAWVPAKCGKVNHAVTAVGFVTENKIDFLIVRNSWGVNWGFEGTFKVPVSNHCGILDYSWLPQVQKGEEPFPQAICPKFYSQCDYKGNSVSTCNGVPDMVAAIGSKAMSFDTNESTVSPYFNFFTEAKCKGKPIFNYESFKCASTNWSYKSKDIKSASPYNIHLPWGCIQHFDQSCFAGKKTLICQSVDDLELSGFSFTPGSMYIYDYTVKSVVFFEEKKFRGAAFGIRNNHFFNTEDVAALNAFMIKAKSVMIVPRDINEPYDPNY